MTIDEYKELKKKELFPWKMNEDVEDKKVTSKKKFIYRE